MRQNMKTILQGDPGGASPRSGSTVQTGRPNFLRLEAESKRHQIEVVSEELRAMMPWISAGKTKVQDASGGQGLSPVDQS
ncbi:MAG: hypothetical protein R2749_30440 [Acidimicrobiales bacterium]